MGKKKAKKDLKIFRVDALIPGDEDTVYVQAVSEDVAYMDLVELFGEIPRSLLKFTVVDGVPKGEELI